MKIEKIGSGKRINESFIIAVFVVLLIILICVSFTLGRYPVSLSELGQYIKYLFTGNNEALSDTIISIIERIRLPRIAGAVLVGAALSVSGASYQGIFRNPMVSPDILGASAGAGFGAALGILFSFSSVGIQLMSFALGLLAVALSYFISIAVGKRESTTLVLVLAGLVISSLFSSFISIIKYVADPYSKLPEITYWLMGSLSSITTKDLLIAMVPALVGIIVLLVIKWRLNVLAFGDEEASSLGVNTGRLRLVVIICSTMVTSSVVSVSGQIGWVGLVIPHLSRMIVGPNYKHLIPASILIGSVFLLTVDTIARNLLLIEIPLGILTAIIGAPFFVYLLLRGKKGWV